jgi:uncharacterized LabA/DUF88 family protein
LNGDRLKLAVFIDFDNIEIGVKSTLNRHFDVGTVLEAIKEKGEVVTKIAYGDWKRAGDHSRSMSQHAIQMVQRNLTPGGDKNGADINLALDALEMAFTRNHINAFVIVGGDSDFMALVEKLKQYDKKVLVVGGRSFTSTILQKNCHEFIAYENLIAPQASSRRPTEKARVSGAGETSLSKAFPLVRRALKVLTDREVSPQLGLLKSTLLQLDSTFTERDYGASTFRDFIEKMAAAGYVNLKQVDRSLLVELKDGEVAEEDPDRQPPFLSHAATSSPGSSHAHHHDQQPLSHVPPPATPLGPATPEQVDEGIRILRDVFAQARTTPHWPMYLRNVKQYIKNAAPSFDERRFGFASFLEVIRAGQRAGLFRLERNRQGILRVFPGTQFPQQVPARSVQVEGGEDVSSSREEQPPADMQMALPELEPVIEAVATAEEVGEVNDLAASAEDQPVESEPVEKHAPRPRRRTAVAAAAASSSAKKKARPRASAPRRTTKKKPADSETSSE